MATCWLCSISNGVANHCGHCDCCRMFAQPMNNPRILAGMQSKHRKKGGCLFIVVPVVAVLMALACNGTGNNGERATVYDGPCSTAGAHQHRNSRDWTCEVENHNGNKTMHWVSRG